MSFTFPLDLAAPYPGLRPFLRDESVIFFGRDSQIDDVLARLKQHQFLAVVGTSGCGKSSLIRAGMLPALESGLMGELGSSWFIADMKPGDAPLTNLAKALMQSGVLGDRWSNTPEGIALLTAALRRSDVSLVNLIHQVGLPQYTNLLVLADQFEEIFRFQQSDPNEALAFVNLLLATGHDRSVPIYVVLTMRSDYLGQCALFPGLPEALNDAQYLCPRLTRDQLAEAIEGPASVFGGEVERALVTQIVNDAGVNSDQLPLVQHVLARMWHLNFGDAFGTGASRTDRVLRLEDYRAVGGLKGNSSPNQHLTGSGNALSQHADEAYFSLGDGASTNEDRGPNHKPSRKQLIAQMLFRCLTERGPSGQYVRRPVKVQDAAAVAGCSVPEVIEVVDVFRREDRSFLSPPVGVTLDENTVLDISHEALIRQWHRFGGQSEQSGENESANSWMESEERSRRRYRRLAEAAENEKTAGLLRNPELGYLNQWWEEFRPTRAWADACVKNSFDRTQSFLNRSLAETKSRKRQIVAVAVLCNALVFVIAVWALWSYSMRPDPNIVRVGIKQWVGYTPLVVANDLKLFGDVRLEFTTIDSIDHAKTLLDQDEIDVGMWLVDWQVLAMSRGTQAKVVLMLDESLEADAIVAREHIRQVSDLRGKPVAYQKDEPSEYLLRRLCEKTIGTSRECRFGDLDLHNVHPEKAATGFIAGEYEAAGTYAPHVRTAKTEVPGTHLLHSGAKEPGIIVDILTVRADYLASHPDKVKALIEGWLQAVVILKDSSHKSYEGALLTARRFNGTYPLGTVWSVKDLGQYVPCSPQEFIEMTAADQMKWGDRSANREFFRPQEGGSSRYHDLFLKARERFKNEIREQPLPEDGDASALFRDVYNW